MARPRGERVRRDTFQPVFRVGLSGADPDRAEEIEIAILETLRRCAERLDPDEVTAAINVVEFRLREGATDPVPIGIRHMLDAMRAWRHCGDPFANLRFEVELGALRQSVAAGVPVLQRLIGALVQGRHRVTAVLQADPAQSSREADLERSRLEGVLAGWAREPPDVPKEAIEGQDRPERAEALASIPVLELADLPREVERDNIEVGRTHPLLLIQDQPTHGILYLDVGLDLAGLPYGLLPHARLLGAVLPKTGTAQRDRLAMARWIDSSTGGITARAWSAGSIAGGPAARLFLRGKALAAEVGQLAAIIEEILLDARLDPARLREVVLEEKARMEAALVSSGHEFVDRRIRASLSTAGRAEEPLNGSDYLQFLQRQAGHGDFEALAGELDMLSTHLLGRGLLIGMAGDGDTRRKAATAVGALCAALDLPEAPLPPVREATLATVEAEALEIFSQVNFVGLGVDVYAAGLAPSGATDSAVRHLSNVWLWEKVRVQGGAYGVLARFDPADGVLTQLSYRDPNLLETLEVFRGAAEFLIRTPSPHDLRSATAAAVGLIDRPLQPALRTLQVLQRWLTGQSFEWRAARRAGLLNATEADFRRLGEAIRAGGETAVAMGGASALDAAEAAWPGWLRRSRLV